MAVHGGNVLPERPRTSLLQRVLLQLRDPLILVLLVAAALTIATGDWTDAAVILTDHTSFDFGWIFKHAQILVDTRNATAKVPEARSATHPERWIVKGGWPAGGN